MDITCDKYFDVKPDIYRALRMHYKKGSIPTVITGHCSNRIYRILHCLGDKAQIYLSYLSIYDSDGLSRAEYLNGYSGNQDKILKPTKFLKD